MSSPTASLRHPVIVVTGANSGVGFGICHRLLVQLSSSYPSDALPRRPNKGGPSYQPVHESPFSPAQQLTLILACRSSERAVAARQRLLNLLDAEVSRKKASPAYDGHAEAFQRGLQIDFIPLNLASMESVFDFAEEASRRYPYITHLILNAGMLHITGFNWPIVFKQLLTEPVAAITTPRFLRQKIAAESPDGLGLVWQCNVFGHYCLLRSLEPLLLCNPYLDSRVEWMSSLDALPEDYDPNDPQLRRTEFSYQASKYQVDLLCTTLARDTLHNPPPKGKASIHHLLVQPGVCSTNMVNSVVGVFLEFLKILTFYMVRMIGSKNHSIQPYKGAAAAVHASLAPPSFLKDLHSDPPQRYGSQTTLWGQDYVGLTPVLEWENNVTTGKSLVELCERYFTIFQQRRGVASSPTTTDSGVIVD